MLWENETLNVIVKRHMVSMTSRFWALQDGGNCFGITDLHLRQWLFHTFNNNPPFTVILCCCHMLPHRQCLLMERSVSLFYWPYTICMFYVKHFVLHQSYMESEIQRRHEDQQLDEGYRIGIRRHNQEVCCQ